MPRVRHQLQKFVDGSVGHHVAAPTRKQQQRDLQLGRDPQGSEAADLTAEERIETERQLEAGARGREDQ